MDMKRRLLVICIASFLSAQTLCAADGDLLATDTSEGFVVYTSDDSLYSAKSSAEVAALPPVAYRAGETVKIKTPNGTISTLVEAQSSGGTVSLTSSEIASGGAYTFVNSVQGEARVGVSWSLGGGGTLSSYESTAFRVDSIQDGPNRRTSMSAAPAVAYSGNDWKSGLSRGGDLTIVSPLGVTHQFTGEGAQTFPFDKSGVWKVTLSPKQGSICEALISVMNGFYVVVQ